jgi:hypothetical protein
MKVYILHRLENSGCCEADGGDSYYTEIFGVFSTEKKAKAFIKKDRYLKEWECTITQKELDGGPSNV